ncbi:MAG: hypothetical protein U0T69_04895 [Chitinophagales bacterium]
MLDKARRMFKIDMQKLRSADSSHLFWMDLTMLLVVAFNLLYLFFGFLFQYPFFDSFIHNISPDFHSWYGLKVFPYVLRYDIIFVLIYAAELLFRWMRSILRKKYDKWWFYPFVHWYDVIMCIPIINGFNFFGAVRLFGLIYRLQRLGVFDLTKTYVYKQSSFVSEVVVEEVADRVIAKMITMAQEEVQKGSPLVTKIVTNVIKPKEDAIVNYLTSRISEAMNVSYSQYRYELKLYVEKIISEAILENDTVDKLRYIPGLGKVFQETLDKAVADVTFNTIDKLMKDIIDPNNTRGVKEVTHGLIESFLDDSHDENKELNNMIVGIIYDSLEEVKHSVLMKEWKIKQKLEEKHKIEEKIKKNKNI